MLSIDPTIHMAKKGISRVEIDPKIYPALKVEAVIRGISPKELVNQLILSSLSSKAREFLETNEPTLKRTPNVTEIEIKNFRPNNGKVSTISIPFHTKPGHDETRSTTSVEIIDHGEVPKRPPIIFDTKSDPEKPKN